MPGKREMIVAYRTARARAQRSTTARLCQEERRDRAALATTVGTVGSDEVALARLTAVRDELQGRGVGVPSLTPALVGARR